MNRQSYRPEQSLGYKVWQLNNLWQQLVAKQLKQLDLTHVQFLLLSGVDQLSHMDVEEVSATPVSITQRRLSLHLGTDIMMTSKVVRVLEKKGYLLRASSRMDGRSKSLILTQKGQVKLTEALEVMQAMDQQFFNRVKSKQTVERSLGELLGMEFQMGE